MITVEMNNPGPRAVAFSPDGRLIVAALSWQEEPIAVIWDRKSGKRLWTLRGPKPPADQHVHDFYSIAVSPDSRYVVAGGVDEMAVMFDMGTGRLVRTYPSDSGSVMPVALSPDGSKLLTGTAETKAVLWDVKSGKQLRSFHCASDEFTHCVSSVAFSLNGRQALAGCDERTFLFDVDAGTLLRTFDGGDDYETPAVFSPDGRYVLTAGRHNWWSSPVAVLWETDTGERVRSLQRPKDAIRSLVFDDDGLRLTVGYEHGFETVWDMNTG